MFVLPSGGWCSVTRGFRACWLCWRQECTLFLRPGASRHRSLDLLGHLKLCVSFVQHLMCTAEVNLILVATLVTSMAMFREQSHFGPNWNVGWIALKCCIHVYGSQRINSNNFGYRMTFPPVPPWGWLFFFSEISSSIYPLLPWYYSRYRHSWSLEDKFKWL